MKISGDVTVLKKKGRRTNELSFALSDLVSDQCSSFLDFQPRQFLFLEARTRKGEGGREDGLSRLECLEMSLNAALLCFILHFLKEA